MSKTASATPNVVSEILAQVTERAQAPPLLDVHQLVDDQPAGPLRLCSRPEPVHDRRLNEYACGQGDSSDTSHPETPKPGRSNPDFHRGRVDSRHDCTQTVRINPGSAQQLGGRCRFTHEGCSVPL